MNFTGRDGAFGAIGMAIGSLITGLIMKKRYKAMAEEEANRLLAEADAKAREEKAKKSNEEADEAESEDEEEDEDEDEAPEGVDEEQLRRWKKVGQKVVDGYRPVDPAEIIGPSEDEDEDYLDRLLARADEYDDLTSRYGNINEDNSADFAGMELTREANSGRKPRLITNEEFDNGRLGEFDKVELDYYMENDVLVESLHDEEVDDVRRVVGDCLDKYGFRKNDEESICVRNFSFQTDYKITKMFAAYEPL